MSARVLMVQGTASDVGKSLVVTALCRAYARRGLRVAPFKAQNMALNAAVTPEGGEIGRAQAVQAAAAGIAPHVDMNPILLKPEPGLRSQVVVLGEALGSMHFEAYRGRALDLEAVVRDSLARLRARTDLVIIEGAGSPVELNLRERELCNMHIAALADAPVLLVADIDRGGIFASLLGTLALLEEDERARVRGLLVNKLRGDPRLFADGVRILEERSGLPVLGVLPYLPELGIPEEDSLGLEKRRGRGRASVSEREIAVVCYPSMSNYDDLLELEREPGVVVRYVEQARELYGADLVVLPGSKSTRQDLAFLRERGVDRVLAEGAQRGQRILGVCGGAQMLGRAIEDPEGVEGEPGELPGLGLLPLITRFERHKRTAVTRIRTRGGPFGVGIEAEGYEIHHGRTRCIEDAAPLFDVLRRGEVPTTDVDGCVVGSVAGTMMHGIFRSAPLRHALLTTLGGAPPTKTTTSDPLDALADAFEASVSMERLDQIIGETT